MKSKLTLFFLLTAYVFAVDFVYFDKPINYDEAKDFCSQLSAKDTEWRLPEIDEMFNNTQIKTGYTYWSGTRVGDSLTDGGQIHESELMIKNFGAPIFTYNSSNKVVEPLLRENKIFAVCTSTKFQKRELGGFVKKPHIIIQDSHKIIWQDIEKISQNKQMSFDEAKNYCQDMSLLSKEWRLPTLDELYSIIDHYASSPSADKDIFRNFVYKFYWTNDSVDEKAYVVGFKVGSVGLIPKEQKSFVRCVSSFK